MNKQDLLEHLFRKRESLSFFNSLKTAVPQFGAAVQRINYEILLAEIQLNKLGGKTLDIRLKDMFLSNFKGIVNNKIPFNCKNVNVYGDNEAGKTSIYDAFIWLLFDKDSLGAKDFDIKPKDELGNVISGLDVTVEATLVIDGKELKLKKIYAENWTKQRGSAEAVFSGHTTNYFINDVPSKKTEYDNVISNLCDEKLFRTLTNALFFNATLPWRERRSILIDAFGDVNDADVIAKNPELSRIEDILKEHSVDDYRKIITGKKSKINDRLKELPNRIDEVNLSIKMLADRQDFNAIENQIKEINAQINEHLKAIKGIESGKEVSEKEIRLAVIKKELIELETQEKLKIQEEVSGFQSQIIDAEITKNKITSDANSMRFTMQIIQQDITGLKSTVLNLRGDWNKENSAIFSCDSKCPTCDQSIPEDAIEEAKNKFNSNKSAKLESITTQGLQYNNLIQSKENELEKLLENIKKKDIELVEINNRIKDLNNLIIEAESIIKNQFKEKVEIKKTEQIALQKELETVLDSYVLVINNHEKTIGELYKRVYDLQSKYAQKEQKDKALNRINELKSEQKQLAKEYEIIESEMYLIESYIRTKMQMLDEKINSRLTISKYKLFDTQINQGILDCCEVAYKGVSYGSMNHASRSKVGIDIINALSQHYNLTAPLFVDNVESITKLPLINTQSINLIVHRKAKTLRIETEEEMNNKIYGYCKNCKNYVYRIPNKDYGEGLIDADNNPIWWEDDGIFMDDDIKKKAKQNIVNCC